MNPSEIVHIITITKELALILEQTMHEISNIKQNTNDEDVKFKLDSIYKKIEENHESIQKGLRL